MTSLPLVFLDTETTGLDANRHQVIELAAALTDATGAVVTKRACSRIRLEPGAVVDARALEVNGYDPRSAAWEAAYYPMAEVLQKFAAWLPAEFVVVAHGASFDTRFLMAAYARARIPPPALTARTVCTSTLAQRLKARGVLDVERATLDHLCERFGVTATRRTHTAAGDVTRLMGVYPHLRALEAREPQLRMVR